MHGPNGHARSRRRDDDLGPPGARAPGHEQVVRPPGGLDRPLGAVQDDVGTVDPDVEGELIGSVVRAGFEVAPRGDRRAVQQTGQESLVPSVPGVAERADDDVGRHERPRGGVPTEGVGHQGEVAETVPADRAAPVFLGYEQ